MKTREEVLMENYRKYKERSASGSWLNVVRWELLFVFVSIIFLSVLAFVSGEFQSFFKVLPLMSLLILCLSSMYYLQILRDEGPDG